MVVCTLWAEIRHSFRLGFPRVPHHDVREHIPGKFETRFSVFGHGDELGRVSGVDAVGFGGYFDGGLGGG